MKRYGGFVWKQNLERHVKKNRRVMVLLMVQSLERYGGLGMATKSRKTYVKKNHKIPKEILQNTMGNSLEKTPSHGEIHPGPFPSTCARRLGWSRWASSVPPGARELPVWHVEPGGLTNHWRYGVNHSEPWTMVDWSDRNMNQWIGCLAKSTENLHFL